MYVHVDEFKNYDSVFFFFIIKAISTSREKCKKTWISRDSRGTRKQDDDDASTILEMTGIDRPGVMSEISAVLAELGCHVSGGVVWTHNARAACVFHVGDGDGDGAIKDPCRVAHVQAQLENVVEAHHYEGERRSITLAAAAEGAHTHTERRLHQLMLADRDFEACQNEEEEKRCSGGTHVKIENCEERGYSILHVRSRDRPKLLFDTVCALTDMQYVVFHAAISSQASIAVQVLYIDSSILPLPGKELCVY